ncbi:MAG: OB-fold domain-containing protein, partial [Deltaproteobacteria bacterium]|nr:OB-fold domain-containing protein [Deltaproteobacteria bacterium]
MVGIVSYGAYVPRYRLKRMAIFQAMGWINPANIMLAQGEKAVANQDEDSLTMATAAGIDCLDGFDRSAIDGIFFASTTMPYLERQNAGIIAGAMNLREDVRSADFSGALKSGTSALICALEGGAARNAKQILVGAADCRLGKMGSPQEMIFGDGGAAFLVGQEGVIAEFKGSYSLTCDFVDHYRGSKTSFDRQWEDRWIRDLGFEEFIPHVVGGLLNKCNIKINDFAKIIFQCHYDSERKNLTRMLKIDPAKVQDPLLAVIGETGTAHSPLMLVRALEEAKPGDKLLVVSFGSGCDALYFEVTDKIAELKKRTGVQGYLAKRAEMTSYQKYVVFRGMVPVDIGLRGEADFSTPWSLVYRKRKAVLALIGLRCQKCGSPQYPPQRVCANPACGAIDEMEDYSFADKQGRILSYTGDMLAASYDPPEMYGYVEFAGGGRFMCNFTDCTLEDLKVGAPVTFSFRKKYYDEKRDIHG